jgi:hypothetical protein
LDEASCAHFVAVSWGIWRTRNEYLWKHKQVIPTTICRLAIDIIRDYNWCCNSLCTTHTPIHVAVWEKPEENWLKCNVDGAIFFCRRKV